MKILMAFVVLIVAVGCNDPTPVLSDFDQACTTNDDCEIVAIDPCSCSCSDAVNSGAVSAVEAATANISCETTLECQACDTAPRCLAGKCETRVPYIVRTEDFATNCETVADCVLIQPGDPCTFCVCGNAVVNAADFTSTVPEQECGNVTPTECNNCAEPGIACTDGVCLPVFPF